ncbi:MAG: GNAT family N-acetyltransferase [Candidatus Bathyarchaeota archaeon]|nr:GNAT family N-acetyltransferase [Candidatus Bathyarchaeota archaeon]
MSVRIREAVQRDSKQLVKLSDELIHLEDWSTREVMLTESLNDPASTIFVAEADETIVGFIELRVFPDFVEGSPIAVILNLVVAKDFRKQGIGSQLIQRAGEAADKRNATETHVWTEFDNQQAIHLYTKHGFTDRHLLLERESEGQAS